MADDQAALETSRPASWRWPTSSSPAMVPRSGSTSRWARSRRIGILTGVSMERLEHSEQWRVRTFELDANGHVNNAVYLNYAEQVAVDHAEALGYGREWSERHQIGWAVREHHVVYHRPRGIATSSASPPESSRWAESAPCGTPPSRRESGRRAARRDHDPVGLLRRPNSGRPGSRPTCSTDTPTISRAPRPMDPGA